MFNMFDMSVYLTHNKYNTNHIKVNCKDMLNNLNIGFYDPPVDREDFYQVQKPS